MESPDIIFVFGEHYGWDEVDPIFMYMAQAMYGDVKQYEPERPPITDPVQ